MGKKSNKKATCKIGLTEQLLLYVEMQEKQFQKELRRLHKRLTRTLADKIEEASTVLNERGDTTNFDLIELADPWSSTAEFLNPARLVLSLTVPRIQRAAIHSRFFIDSSNLYFVPESYAIAIEMNAVSGEREPIYAMADPDDIVAVLLFNELDHSNGRLPKGVKVTWITQWLDELIAGSTEPQSTEVTTDN